MSSDPRWRSLALQYRRSDLVWMPPRRRSASFREFNDIKPEARRDERQFWREFEAARPRILGALLDAVSAGLRNLPNVSLDRPPRMADFATWATACEMAVGSANGEFLRIYENNRSEGRNLALESSPLYEPIQALAEEGFIGSGAELLVSLNRMRGENLRRSVRWPKTPSALGTALRCIAGNLRAAGIEIEFSRADRRRRRMVSLTHAVIPQTLSAPSAVSAASPDNRPKIAEVGTFGCENPSGSLTSEEAMSRTL